MNFRELVDRFFISEIEKEQGDMISYIECLEDGSFVDVLNYGVAEDKRGFLLLDPVLQPGALYCGGMGSGKSIAMRFTISTHLMANSKNTVYVMVDPIKGMGDYTPLFKYEKNVVKALNSGDLLVPVIEMVHAEMMSRKEEFYSMSASNIYTYEEARRKREPSYKGLARMLVCIEEFHIVPNHEKIKYHQNSDRPGTAAYMLKEILRVGRSYGITFLVATQRATADDFPSSLKPGITQLMAFKVNSPGDATAINLPLAMDIPSGLRGRCVYEGGFIQFPYIDDKNLTVLLEKYYQPLEAELLKYQVEDYHTAFSGDSGLVKIKTLRSLIDNYQQWDFNQIALRILEYFNFKVEVQPNKGLELQLIAERDGIRYGVLLMTQPREQGTEKSVQSTTKALEILNCTKVIVFNVESQTAMPVMNFINKIGGMLVDREDMKNIASVVDNRAELEKGNHYINMYNNLSLAKKEETKEEIASKNEPVALTSAPPPGTPSLMDLREKLKNSLKNQQSQNKS